MPVTHYYVPLEIVVLCIKMFFLDVSTEYYGLHLQKIH